MRTRDEINSSEWFGRIPNGWNMVPITALFRFNKGLSLTKSDLVNKGCSVISYGQIHSKANVGVVTNTELYRYVPTSLAVNCPSAHVLKEGFIFADTSEDLAGCGANVRISESEEIYGGYHTIVLNPRQSFNSKYLAYLFTTDAWRSQIRRDLVDVKLFSVNQTSLSETYVVVPPKDVQCRLVSFLDQHCSAIDEDVAKRQKVIEKLKEYKKALIFHAVTRGLDNEAEMCKSDIKWAGNIPKTWNISKLKSLFDIKKRIAGVDGLTVLSISQTGIKPKDFSSGKGQFAESYSHYQRVYRGDFAMNHMDLLTGWVDISDYDGVTSPDYRVFTIRNEQTCHPTYFKYLFQMCYFNRVFFGSANGVADKGRMRLQTSAFRDFLVPVPPMNEQIEIASYLDTRCKDIDEAILRQEQLIERLGEYRKSLILHAVTGQIDCLKE